MLLILRREYVERVRTKSFLILTFLVPVLMVAMVVLPTQMAMRSMGGSRRLVVATSNPALAEAIRQQLDAANPVVEAGTPAGPPRSPHYVLTIDSRLTEEERAALRRQVTENRIDGFLWITPEALQSRQVEYTSKQSANLTDGRVLELALQAAVMRHALAGYGVKDEQAAELLRPFGVKAVQIANGKEGGSSGVALFISVYGMVMVLYMAVLLYGIAVMRSVIEEKSSRIVEVMLASTTPRHLLAGKILGVGAVGLTQIVIWVAAAAALSLPGLVAGGASLFHLPLSTAIAFAGFFVLGYFSYSALYAVLGATVNREQEAQQVQFIILMPLILSVILLQAVIQNPSSPLAFWLSLVPLCSPLVMFARIVIATPPLWQVVLSVALTVLTIYGTLVVGARIYRVGILMYGKRPTLPELLKWMKYA
jgi:ABC-2 type transport system permease protein